MLMRFFVSLLFICCFLYVQAQLQPGLLGTSSLVTNKGLYNVSYGGGFGGLMRYCYGERLQFSTYLHKTFYHVDDNRIKFHNMLAYGWRFGYTPYLKSPFTIAVGGRGHRYRTVTRPIDILGGQILPSFIDRRRSDAIELSVSYPVLPFLELALVYQKEPFLLWYNPGNVSCLSLEARVISGRRASRNK